MRAGSGDETVGAHAMDAPTDAPSLFHPLSLQVSGSLVRFNTCPHTWSIYLRFREKECCKTAASFPRIPQTFCGVFTKKSGEEDIHHDCFQLKYVVMEYSSLSLAVIQDSVVTTLPYHVCLCNLSGKTCGQIHPEISNTFSCLPMFSLANQHSLRVLFF